MNSRPPMPGRDKTITTTERTVVIRLPYAATACGPRARSSNSRWVGPGPARRVRGAIPASRPDRAPPRPGRAPTREPLPGCGRGDITNVEDRHQRHPAHQVGHRWRNGHHRGDRRLAGRAGGDHRRWLGGHPGREGRPIRGRGTRAVPGPASGRPMGLPARRGRYHGLVPPAGGLQTAASHPAVWPGRRRSRAAGYFRPGHRALPGPANSPLGRGDTPAAAPA
jgi:hypothetical protein